MESWPTLVLGDLFDMLLPMLSIYQEYVRNHHYSLQTLAECKQRPAFNRLLELYEEKPVCSGRRLENYLTAPMHRIPAYIITLHDLLALTPHDHVERNALENAQSVLEDLSTVMHDEVSETENIRKNLSIERQIVEGCEMLLDVNQIFIRQGNLIQVTENRKCKTFGGLSLKPADGRKEIVRQCFLFSGYLLLTTRSSSGRLHLSKNGAYIALADATLIEDFFQEVDAESVLYGSRGTQEIDLDELTFKLVVRSRDKGDVTVPPYTVTLMAPSAQEKAAWTSDISQCIENLAMISEDADAVSVASRQSLASVRSDPKLFTDDADIKYCKALNCCKLPKIRHASLERLLERLLDIRFLSVDFLNTFLITYRVFTSAASLLDTLLQFYYANNAKDCDYLELFSPVSRKTRSVSLPTESLSPRQDKKKGRNKFFGEQNQPSPSQPISITVSDVKMPSDNNPTETKPRGPVARTPDRLCPSSYHSYRRHSSPSALGESAGFEFPESSTDTPLSPEEHSPAPLRHGGSRNYSSPFLSRGNIRTRAQSSSSDFVSGGLGKDKTNLETNSLLSSSPDEDIFGNNKFELQPPPKQRGKRSRACTSSGPLMLPRNPKSDSTPAIRAPTSAISVEAHEDKTNRATKNAVENFDFSDEVFNQKPKNHRRRSSPSVQRERSPDRFPPVSCLGIIGDSGPLSPDEARNKNSTRRPSSPCRLYKIVKDAEERVSSLKSQRRPSPPKLSSPASPLSSPRSPLSPSANSVSAGVVVTSSRPSRRRSSISSAASAFAAATAGASPSYASTSPTATRFRFGHTIRELLSSNTHMATMRVLTVLRHWVTKHPEDFEADPALKEQLISSMNYILNNDSSTNLEQKFATAIIRILERNHEELEAALSFEAAFVSMSKRPEELATFDKISATQLAEQLTFLEHLIFSKIPAHEFLNLSWMKSDKNVRAPNILRVTKRFNETSSLVASEILKHQSPSARATVIEKWVAVAEVCRNLHNFNSVLEISSAFMSSSIYRLKKTWEKVSKQTRTLIDRLQKLVSSDGRFKNMREALRCADTPCIPYLGFYLTDLAFIEDGTPNSNENGLINFSKMRMIAQVIEEIKHYQQNKYTIEHDKKIIQYLTSKDNLMDEDMLYRTSLALEPRKRASKMKQPMGPEI